MLPFAGFKKRCQDRLERRAAVIRGGVADMKSLNTNILLYAADEDCREHDAVIRLVNNAAAWARLHQAVRHVERPPARARGFYGGFTNVRATATRAMPVARPAAS